MGSAMPTRRSAHPRPPPARGARAGGAKTLPAASRPSPRLTLPGQLPRGAPGPVIVPRAHSGVAHDLRGREGRAARASPAKDGERSCRVAEGCMFASGASAALAVAPACAGRPFPSSAGHEPQGAGPTGADGTLAILTNCESRVSRRMETAGSTMDRLERYRFGRPRPFGLCARA